MSNYKVKVNNEAESREVQGLFFELGGQWATCGRTYNNMVNVGDYVFFNCSKYLQYGLGINKEELTILQLKDLVVLKRNSIDDATHTDQDDWKWYIGADSYVWGAGNASQLQQWDKSSLDHVELKPIEKKEMKEYLVPQDNGKYALTKATEKRVSDWVEVPEGAEAATFCKNEGVNYWKENGLKWFSKVDKEWRIYGDMEEHIKNHDHKIVWTRHTQPEELPFADDEPKSLNDTYAEIEQVRQDNVNNPSHYSDSSIECIDAMEAMMTPEQFIGYLRGNVFKYQWRYEKKNGIEDLKKAQWYLDKLVTKINEK